MTDDSIITVCQGPPVCALIGDAAIAAQVQGCPWCKRIHIDEFGGQTVTEPYSDKPKDKPQ